MAESETFRQRLLRRLESFSRVRRGVHNAALACRLGLAAAGVGIFALLGLGGYVPNPFVNLGLFALGGGVLAWLGVRYLLRRRRFRSHLDEAFRAEDLAGGLNSRLVSALDFSLHDHPGPLMRVVLGKADADMRADFEARVDRRQRNRQAWRLAAAAVVLVALGLTPWFAFARVGRNFADALFAAGEMLFPVVYRVSPPAGRHVLALGKATRVEIAFAARGYRQVTLVERAGDKETRHVLAVDDAGRAGLEMSSHVESQRHLHFEFGRRRSGEVELIFTDRPVLENMQTELVYPAYTRMLPRSLEGVQERLFALAGTRITMGLAFSKELARATLTFDDGEELPLETVGRFATTALVHTRARRATLQVEDVHGFALAQPVEISLELQQDEKPEVFLPNTLKAEMPVLPEGMKLFGFGVRLKDDFGVTRCVLKWTKSTVGNPDAITQRGEVERLISPPRPSAMVEFQKVFESLAPQPGDRVSFKVEVYDNRSPDPQMAASAAKALFVYQQGLEEFQIGKLGLGSMALTRERIAKSKRAAGVTAPAAAQTAEKVWNEFDAKIDSSARPPRVTGQFAPAVRDYFRLFSTAVQNESAGDKVTAPTTTPAPATAPGKGRE
jgi:hypothetical protein